MVLFVIGLVLAIGGIVLLVVGVDLPDSLVFLGFTILILGIVLMIAGAIQDEKENKNACEDIGGAYVVIKREYSVSLKQVVDVYGCVK